MVAIKVAVLGDGGWGTTLAILLRRKGIKVCLWGAFADYVSFLDKKRVNKKFLPGVKIPADIKITADLEQALEGAGVVVLAVPSRHLAGVLRRVRKLSGFKRPLYLSVTKGIDPRTLLRMTQVVRRELPGVEPAVLSGPTIAHEVACGMPTTCVVASRDKRVRRFLQEIFITERFRVYTNADITGVELGGSLKNVIAIACGISDGMGFGTNAKAALLSRGLAEITRLGCAMGARRETFSGISGLGDLVTTCISAYSRNRYVGEQVGRGKSLKQITARMQMIAEGISTAKGAYALSKKYKVHMPITKEIYLILYKNKSPLTALRDLMRREGKEE